MLGELLEHDAVTETCVLRGPVGFMALHGGIEEGTAELAGAAAEAAGASFYSVVVGDGLWWHVPSTKFDPTASPALAAYVSHIDVALSLHGYGRRALGATVLLGGRNRDAASVVARSLRRHTDLAVIADLDAIPRGLKGLHSRNPVNLPPQHGVQIELPPSARNGSVGQCVVTALRDAATKLREN